MALTQISTAGVKDDAVTAGKIPANAVGSSEIAADAVTGAKIADNAIDSEHYTDGSIDNAHLADDAVGIAELSATGTASSSTFLRGDNSWTTVNTDLVSDTSPQLGGDLASNGNNILMADNDQIRLGAAPDVRFYHDGSHSYLTNATGNFRLRSDSLKLEDQTNGHSMITAAADGAVELYYDNSKKFETTSDGATVTGDINVNSGSVLINTDGQRLKLGAGQDLQLYHDGSDSYIQNTTGALYISPKTGENGIQIVPDGEVRLYYDNAQRLEINNGGATVKTVGDTVLTLLADSDNNNTNNWPVIDFRINNTSGNSEARVAYREDTAALKFDIAGSEKVGVNQYGLVFNGDTAVTNALNDYETGTFTPTCNVEGQGATSLDVAKGVYVKIGNLVHVSIEVELGENPSNKTTGNAWDHGGLPFITQNDTDASHPGLRDYRYAMIVIQPDTGSTFGSDGHFIFRINDNSANGRIEWQHSDLTIKNASLFMQDTAFYQFSCTYPTSL